MNRLIFLHFMGNKVDMSKNKHMKQIRGDKKNNKKLWSEKKKPHREPNGNVHEVEKYA